MNLSDLDWYGEAIQEAADTAVSGAGVFMQPTTDTNPDSLLSMFSNAGDGPGGFGPGDYSGGYTGEGDMIYWGPFGDEGADAAESAAIAAAQEKASREAARKGARKGAREARKTATALAKEVKKAAVGEHGSSGTGTVFNPMGHFGPGGHATNAASAVASAIKSVASGTKQESSLAQLASEWADREETAAINHHRSRERASTVGAAVKLAGSAPKAARAKRSWRFRVAQRFQKRYRPHERYS